MLEPASCKCLQFPAVSCAPLRAGYRPPGPPQSPLVRAAGDCWGGSRGRRPPREERRKPRETAENCRKQSPAVFSSYLRCCTDVAQMVLAHLGSRVSLVLSVTLWGSAGWLWPAGHDLRGSSERYQVTWEVGRHQWFTNNGAMRALRGVGLPTSVLGSVRPFQAVLGTCSRLYVLVDGVRCFRASPESAQNCLQAR
eukprot:6147361-Alexandrium_andersonii.AAC.1